MAENSRRGSRLTNPLSRALLQPLLHEDMLSIWRMFANEIRDVVW